MIATVWFYNSMYHTVTLLTLSAAKKIILRVNTELESGANQRGVHWEWTCVTGYSGRFPLYVASSALTLYKDSVKGDITASANGFHWSRHTHTHCHTQHVLFMHSHVLIHKCTGASAHSAADTHLCTHTVEYSYKLTHVAIGWRGYKAVVHQ